MKSQYNEDLVYYTILFFFAHLFQFYLLASLVYSNSLLSYQVDEQNELIESLNEKLNEELQKIRTDDRLVISSRRRNPKPNYFGFW